MRYRRSLIPGGTYFFTVNLADRSSHLLIAQIDALRSALRNVQVTHPFKIAAMVILPDHLHSVWTLPPEDCDYAARWSVIKARFSHALPADESVGTSRKRKRERGIWQRRYWEHQIRDERDLQQHVDYIHYNPVKHGYVDQAVKWPHSSIHRYIRHGLLTPQWGTAEIDGKKLYGERT